MSCFLVYSLVLSARTIHASNEPNTALPMPTSTLQRP